MKFNDFKKLNKINENIIEPALEKAMFASNADKDLILSERIKISNCSTYIYTLKCKDCGQLHFKGYSRCKSKFCAVCNKTKAAIWTARLYQYCRDWLSAGKYIVFLNFTVRDRDNLFENLKIIENAWRDMVNKNNKFKKVFKSKFVGGCRSLEVKIGENSNLWHPHYHCIALKEKPSKDTYFLHYAWPLAVQAAGGDIDERNLKILPFYPYDKSKVTDRETYNLQLVKSIKEVVKYMLKVDYENLPSERLAELVTATKGKRQVNLWGCLYNLKKLVDGDYDKMSDNDVKDFVCQVCGCTEATMNTLAREIWEDDYIIDLKRVPPEKLPSEQFVNSIKRKNGKLPPIEKINPVQIEIDFDKE